MSNPVFAWGIVLVSMGLLLVLLFTLLAISWMAAVVVYCGDRWPGFRGGAAVWMLATALVLFFPLSDVFPLAGWSLPVLSVIILFSKLGKSRN